jgi:hypothetical protein
VPNAREALENVRARGARSQVVHALVRVRALEMVADMRRADIAAMN